MTITFGPTGPKLPRISDASLPGVSSLERNPWPDCVPSEKRNSLTRELQQNLSAGLNCLEELAISASCKCSMVELAERSRDLKPSESSEIALALVDWRTRGDPQETWTSWGARALITVNQINLRRAYLSSLELMREIENLAPWRDSPGEGERGFNNERGPNWGREFTGNVRACLGKWYPRMSQESVKPELRLPLVRSEEAEKCHNSNLPEESLHRINFHLGILEQSVNRIKGVIDFFPLTNPPGPFETHRIDFLSIEEAQRISETILRHRRAPGDPTIREKGVVISNVTHEVVRDCFLSGFQTIECLRDGKVAGVSMFLPPDAPSSTYAAVNERFAGSRNGVLHLILVHPEYQGKGVFGILMDATLTAMQACGAERLIGHVEQTNERAMEIYREKLSAEIASDFQKESGGTVFYGLSIPIPHRDHKISGQFAAHSKQRGQ